jgi:hypothetical protein
MTGTAWDNSRDNNPVPVPILPISRNAVTPQEFIACWKGDDLTERAGAQARFDDLCDLLGVDKPL